MLSHETDSGSELQATQNQLRHLEIELRRCESAASLACINEVADIIGVALIALYDCSASSGMAAAEKP